MLQRSKAYFFMVMLSLFFSFSLHGESFRLRPATEEDLPTLYELVCELAVYEGKDLATLPLTKENLRRFGFSTQPYFYVELAEIEGKVVGYSLYYYTFSANQGLPALYLEDLYVKAEYRKQGIGTALLQQLFLYAQKHECCRVEWHVFDWNTDAIHFYQKLGGQLREGLILVRKPLTS